MASLEKGEGGKVKRQKAALRIEQQLSESAHAVNGNHLRVCVNVGKTAHMIAKTAHCGVVLEHSVQKAARKKLLSLKTFSFGGRKPHISFLVPSCLGV